MKKVIENQVVQAGDLKEFFVGKQNSEVSGQIKKLINKKMLVPENEGTRKYVLRFDKNHLLRSVIRSLGKKAFTG